MRLRGWRSSLIGELLVGSLSRRNGLPYMSSKGQRKVEAQIWVFTKGYSFVHVGHVGGG